MMITLLQMLQILLNAAQFIVIAHVILSLLIAFNIINTHNEFVRTIWEGLEKLLAPIYAPIRRILPDTGALDLSPMVLLLGLSLLDRALSNAIVSMYL